MHAIPLAHAVPQAPQFIASVCVLTQRPPHEVSPAPHIGPVPLSAGSTPVSAGGTGTSMGGL